MLIALALTLAAGFVQDESAVAYREGLYEEVDQGNLERALALYAKVLKADGAEAALKAKALFRQGQCHEKQSRRKEAEQAYRDVIDRFPGAEDAVRRARARLAALNGKDAGGVPIEAQIAQLILDLGSNTHETREGAIRRLTLLGGVAVPDLRRALQHKDSSLSVGAARVLVEQEQYDGCYETFLRAARRGSMNRADHPSVARLLDVREEDRKQFVKDIGRIPPWWVEEIVTRLDADKRSAELQAALADRIVAEDDAAALITAWFGGADVKQIVALIDRLAAPEKRQLKKLHPLLCELHVWVKDGRVEPAVSAALRRATEGADMPGRLRESAAERNYRSGEVSFMNAEMSLTSSRALHQKLAVWLPTYMTPSDAFSVFSTWLKTPDEALRREVQRAVWNRVNGQPPFPRTVGAFDFILDVVASSEYADDVRDGALSHTKSYTLSPAQQAKLTPYYVSLLGRTGGPKTGVPLMEAALRHLSQALPADAKERDAIYDRAFQLGLHLDMEKDPRYVAAAARALRSEAEDERGLALNVLAGATVAQQLDAPAWLKDAADAHTAAAVAQMFASALGEVAADRRERALQSAKPLFAGGSRVVRLALFGAFVGSREAALQDIMKGALADPDAEIRRHAIRHWTKLKDGTSVPLLVQALKDDDEENRDMAVNGLADTPSLDAVPALIEMLRAPGSKVRDSARRALEKIRKHVDEQEEWRKWYEDVKKRGEKK